jgi:hypothetical protein
MAWKELFLLWIRNFRTQNINVRSAMLVHICDNMCRSGFNIRDSCCLVLSIPNFTSGLLLSNNRHNSILKPHSFYRPGYNPPSSFTIATKAILKFSLATIKKEIHIIIPLIAIGYITCWTSSQLDKA